MDANALVAFLCLRTARRFFLRCTRSYNSACSPLGRDVSDARFSFFLAGTAHLAEPSDAFRLRRVRSPRSIPIRRPHRFSAPGPTPSSRRRFTLVFRADRRNKGQRWQSLGGEFLYARILHMAEDSQWFRTARNCARGFRAGRRQIGSYPWSGARQAAFEFEGGAMSWRSTFRSARTCPNERYVPLYEAKMIHQFDHRWATYEADGDDP